VKRSHARKRSRWIVGSNLSCRAAPYFSCFMQYWRGFRDVGSMVGTADSLAEIWGNHFIFNACKVGGLNTLERITPFYNLENRWNFFPPPPPAIGLEAIFVFTCNGFAVVAANLRLRYESMGYAQFSRNLLRPRRLRHKGFSSTMQYLSGINRQ